MAKSKTRSLSFPIAPVPPPSAYERRILLLTVGLAPQIVTETLYALAFPPDDSGEGAFIPTEIHIVTTTKGRDAVAAHLLDPKTGQIAALARDYVLPDLTGALTPERVHVITDKSGGALSDIASHDQNARTADLIIDIVRRLTEDDSAALHVSLAGGRKTMGFLIGYALSLFGRPQDRLSHVLLDPRLENHPSFFYPPPEPIALDTRSGEKVSTAGANITLAHVPFLTLRLGMPQELLERGASYSETIHRAQMGFAEPRLVIDHSRQSISCHGKIIRLEPLRLAFYAWLARRRAEGTGDGGAIGWWETGPKDGAAIVAEYRRIAGVGEGKIADQEGQLAEGVPKEKFEQNKHHINNVLSTHLSIFAAPYSIHERGKIPGTSYSRFGLELDPAAISFGSIEEREGENPGVAPEEERDVP